ncbi:MAG: CHAT domain-containing protein [Chitinophagaceae bacterium]|nr:CHAT domain-containing protein [Chitinophagaceae bacterium]
MSLLAASAAMPQDFRTLYKKADYYFNLDQPTAKTDSLATSLFLQVADLAIQSGDFHSSIESLIKAGSIRQTYQRYADANALYRKAIDLNHQSEKDTALFYRAFLYIGSSYYSSGNTADAKIYFEKASILSMFHPRSESFPDQEHLYNSLGTIYFESGNYQQAKNYFEKALRLLNASPTHSDEATVTLQSNIANCLLQLKQHEQAIKIFRQLLNSGLQERVLTHNIAHAYYEENKLDSAVYYFNLVERRNDIVMVRMQNDLGRIYTLQDNWTGALKALDSALTVSKIVFRETKNRDRALNYFIRSTLAEKQHKHDEALKWCNEGIKEIHFHFTAQNVYDVPSNETETLSPVTFLELLQQKARLLEGRHRRTNERADLDACLRTHLAAIHTAAYIKRCFDNDEAKLYFQQDRRAVYHDALRIAHELMDDGRGNEYIAALLEITEAYKGSIVYENIQHLELAARVKLPPWALEKERSLKQSLAFYTTRLNNAISPEESNRLRENLIATNVELSRLLALYDSDPAYQLFRNQRVPGLNLVKNISDKLDDETAIISYNVSPDNIYILAKTARDFKTHTVRRNASVDSIFKNFINETYGQVEGRRYTGYGPGNELYALLLRPVLDMIGSKEKWIILPDGFLSYLPFDALCVSSNDRDYLLLHRQVSYHYSFSLFLLDDKKSHASMTGRELFFAPFSSETPVVTSKGLSPLPFSRDEITGSSVTMMLSTEATKAKWLASVENFSMLHLATHATTGNGNDNTQIYFYPSDSLNVNNNLYVDEIYQLNLQHTGLIVLSACETAGGKSTSGEGLLSLSRAFLYAGAKGIVSSLWKTEDRVSAYLMKQMYVEMQNGYSTAEALRRAKLDLLEDESVSARYKTPNYWGNFVYVGSVGTGKKNLNAVWWVTALVLAILVIGVLLMKKSYSA